MDQQQQPEESEQPGPSVPPIPHSQKPTRASLGWQAPGREGIKNSSGPRTSKNGSISRSKGKQVDCECSHDASAILDTVPLTHKQDDSLTATERPSKTKVSEIDDLANLLGHESSSLLSRRHNAVIVKYSELFGDVTTVDPKGCCKDLNELVTLLLEVLTRKETQILELKDRDHQRVERQRSFYLKCLQMADSIPANITTDFATQNEEDSEPEIAVSSPGETIQPGNRGSEVM